jgi:diguanylate cyclase (GGDEF)-like protein
MLQKSSSFVIIIFIIYLPNDVRLMKRKPDKPNRSMVDEGVFPVDLSTPASFSNHDNGSAFEIELQNLLSNQAFSENAQSPNETGRDKLRRLVEELLKENRKLKQKLQKVAYQNKKLDEQVFDLITISQANKVFVAHHNETIIAEILLSIIAERINTSKCSLLLIDEDTQTFKVKHSIGLNQDKLRSISYGMKEGLFWRLISNGEPFSVVDIEGNLRFHHVFSENELDALDSSYWIPLKTKENVIGIITIDSREVKDIDLSFFSLLASQAAIAFESAFLYKKLEMASQRLEKQMHNLSILYDVGKALNFIDDLTKLLTLILDRGIDIAESQKGSLMLYDEKTDELVVRVVRGIDKETEEKILSGEIQCTKIRNGEGVAGRVFYHGDPIIINKTKEDPRFKESKESRVDNILCVPLKVYDESIGVINITNKKNGEFFTKDDLSIVTALANQAAVAINNARLYELAVTDSLTKLLIRRHFMQRLEDELRRSRRYQHKLSLVMVDLDNFKEINDTYGHQAGDKVLAEICKIFKKSIRTSDLVGRYGGDEFVFALPETDTGGARVFSERLRKRIEGTQIPFESFLIGRTVSLGIATYPDHTEDFSELIKLADVALLKSKREGRNRTFSHNEISPDEFNELLKKSECESIQD